MRFSALTAILLVPLSSAGAATYVVHADGTGDFPTIQSAVDATSDGDVIELADGLFIGPGNRDVRYSGKAITIRSQSGIPGQCVIDCEASETNPHCGFRFWDHEDAGAVLAGVKITNGYMPSAPFAGAAISVGGCGPTISGCVIVGNKSSAIWLEVPMGVVIENCLIAGNTASADYGGGIVMRGGYGTIAGCTITGNQAAWGGGVSNGAADFIFRGSILWGNCAPVGPEMALHDGSAVFYCSDLDLPGIALINGTETLGYDEDTVFEDPIFCAPVDCSEAPTTSGDYRLDAASICLAAASPCGELIGALSQGCSGTVPVQEATWGRIKSRFGAREKGKPEPELRVAP